VASTEVEDGEVDDAKALNPTQSADKSLMVGQLASTPSSSSNLSASAKGGSQTVSSPRPTEPALPASVSSQSTEPSRADTGRNLTSASVLDKLHPGLPSRPDVPIPNHHSVDRHLSSRSGDRREPHHSRLDRPNDGLRDRGRDSSNFDRRAPDVPSRDMNRPGDRGLAAERDRERDRHDFKRRGAEPVRDSRDLRDIRDSRDRLPMDNTRLSDPNGRLSRNDDMPPPKPIAEASQGPTVNAEPPINPARAAQIFGANESPRTDSQRLNREEHRDRPPSRPHSPRRGDRYSGLDRDSSDSRRNDSAPGRPPPPYTQEYPRGRHDEPQIRSSGTRNDRAGERGPPERLRDASSFQPTPTPARPLDLEHGRLSRPQPDPNYGRLNDAPASQIPSGPRDRSNRGGAGVSRLGNTSQPRFEPRVAPQELPRPPTPDKQPPTGPAATRAPRRTGSGLYDAPAAASVTTHTAPLAAPPTAGIHPERLKHIDPVAAQLATSNTTSQIAQPTLSNVPSGDDGIHPSRMPSFHGDQSTQRQAPPAIQTSNITSSTARVESPGASGPPSGPRGQQPISSTSMSPGGINPPTGPASSERTRGPNRHIAGINSTLQQAGQRNVPERASERITNIRGRGGRNSMGGPVFDLPPSPAPLTPTVPSSSRDAPGSGAGDRVRDPIVSDRPSDLFASRGMNGGGTDNERDRERADSRSGGGTRGRDPASRRDGGRSGRHSRRASRSRSPGRDGERERERERARERGAGPLDEPQRGDYRDRGRGGDGRERRQNERDIGRRDGEKVQGRNGEGRDVLPPPRPGNEPDWGGSGLGASDRSSSGAGLGGGGGARRDMRSSNDSRRDSRGDGSGGSGRKRRGDEGGMSGVDNRGHDKRPRMMR
jgi:THO complex subunit 2